MTNTLKLKFIVEVGVAIIEEWIEQQEFNITAIRKIKL